MRRGLRARGSRSTRSVAAAALTALAVALAFLPATRALAGPPAGTISELSGGPGSGAAVAIGQNDAAIAVSSGNLFFADQVSNTVRELKRGASTETVVAGNAIAGFAGDGKRATAAELNGPAGVAVDGNGNVVIADTGNAVLRVAAATSGTFYGQAMSAHDIYTIAGLGAGSGDGIPAAQASLSNPLGIAADSEGNLLVAENGRGRLRVIAATSGTFYGQAMTANDIYTIAGTGTAGFSGDGGPASAAQLNGPSGAVLDTHGNVVVADSNNQVVRVVAESTGAFYGQSMTAGDIYTVAGTGTTGGYSGDGAPATSALLRAPTDVAVDHHGNLVIADSANSAVRVVAVRSATYYGQPMQAGDIYTVAGTGARGFSGDGGAATNAMLGTPQAVVVDTAANIVIGDDAIDGFAGRVRLVAAATGTYFGQAVSADDIQTIAGNGLLGSSENGAPALDAALATPDGVTTDSHGNVVFAESLDNLVRVAAGQTGTFFGRPMIAGDVYTIAGSGQPGFGGDGGPATSAELFRPQGVGVDAAGDVVIADYDNFRIRFVPVVSGTHFGVAMTGGDIYTIAGNGGFGFSPNGTPATSAVLDNASGAVLDASGNLVISDLGDGVVQMVPTSSGTFYGLAMTTGDIYVIAGGGTKVPGDRGLATNAAIGVTRVVIDASHNLVMSDAVHYRVRVVPPASGTFYGQSMLADHIYTIAGNGKFGDGGNGRPATNAKVSPTALTIDSAGDVIVADYFDSVIRVVAGTTGTHYGQAMTKGDVYTIAGNRVYGFGGDGHPATHAELAQPFDVTVTPAGTVVVADTGNNRLRQVGGP